jgi:hypothetical protein
VRGFPSENALPPKSAFSGKVCAVFRPKMRFHQRAHFQEKRTRFSFRKCVINKLRFLIDHEASGRFAAIAAGFGRAFAHSGRHRLRLLRDLGDEGGRIGALEKRLV